MKGLCVLSLRCGRVWSRVPWLVLSTLLLSVRVHDRCNVVDCFCCRVYELIMWDAIQDVGIYVVALFAISEKMLVHNVLFWNTVWKYSSARAFSLFFMFF